jgi:hypothetical protein
MWKLLSFLTHKVVSAVQSDQTRSVASRVIPLSLSQVSSIDVVPLQVVKQKQRDDHVDQQEGSLLRREAANTLHIYHPIEKPNMSEVTMAAKAEQGF